MSDKFNDNYANQLNPNSSTYWSSRGVPPPRPSNWEEFTGNKKPNDNNRANQLNPNNEAYNRSRGVMEEPGQRQSESSSWASSNSYNSSGSEKLEEGGMSFWAKVGLGAVGLMAGAAAVGAIASNSRPRSRRNENDDENE